ncbi:hypothetical protein NWFMUON74_39240 [Nocardia wallacei]|uniref:Uncharacterized protein n=1 Tax=Nocardia wallacei TaxID=480035 RepID=A0A7G1KLT3_9NOCA|nr:hypothetical protein NWFMUON74_39240 [Nocardia wallacei]
MRILQTLCVHPRQRISESEATGIFSGQHRCNILRYPSPAVLCVVLEPTAAANRRHPPKPEAHTHRHDVSFHRHEQSLTPVTGVTVHRKTTSDITWAASAASGKVRAVTAGVSS